MVGIMYTMVRYHVGGWLISQSKIPELVPQQVALHQHTSKAGVPDNVL